MGCRCTALQVGGLMMMFFGERRRGLCGEMWAAAAVAAAGRGEFSETRDSFQIRGKWDFLVGCVGVCDLRFC